MRRYGMRIIHLAARALVAPFAAGAGLALRSFVSPDIGDERWRLLAYAVGLGLAAIVLFGDPLRLGSWFLD
jgi:hypothetical protein